jgi:hypothetical protein
MEQISHTQAIDAVIRAVKEPGLEGCRVLNKYLENRDMIHAMFIEHLEDAARSYYIVYWLINGRILCIAEVNARTGTVLSFTPFTHPGSEHYHNFLKAEEIIHDRFPEEQFLESSLVWQCCMESTSSIFPFRRIRTREHTYFMSLSGELYSVLTPLLEV